MKISSVCLEFPTVLAPLAGITNLPFRLIIKELGCGLVCSEMVSANGLIHQSRKTFDLLNSTPREKPLSLQIFGTEPAIMAEAARMIQDSGADILDINFGCSVRKVVKTGSGVALMRTPEKAEKMLRAVRDVLSIPLTIKIRSGWDASGDQALHIARIAEDCGADAIAVHPRTASQGFRGRADWRIIKRVKETVSVPVIGNGDIVQAEDALRMIEETGCDAIMVGRTAIGSPWIFAQISALLEGKEIKPVSLAERREMMLRYLHASVTYIDEIHACRMMRSRLGWFVKGLHNNSRFRESIKKLSTEAEGIQLINEYMDSLEAYETQAGLASMAC